MAEEYNNRVVMGGTKWWDSSTTSSLSSSSPPSVVFSDHQSLHMMSLRLQDGMSSMYSGEKPFFSTGEATPELMKPVKGFDQFSHESSSGIFQALMEPPQPPPMQSGYGYNQAAGYGSSEDLMPNCNWTNTTSSNKIHHEIIPQFLKANSNQQPHFINNINSHGGSFWNAVADPRPPSFFPTPFLNPPELAAPTFHDKHHHKNNMMAVKNTNEAGRKSNSGSGRTSTASTTSTGGATAKRSRNEDSSTLPPFKVRKEKMGDRITALQQLVSPFGKTDTASVLSEAIEYIKFLHDQVNVLSTPYLKSGASLQQQRQIHDKFKDPEAPRKDLRSRGLCLVPVSSTFPVAHETTMDFWTPAFGSTTFR